MLIKFSTEKSLTAVSAALQLAVAANHFVIIQVHDLHETMDPNGKEIVRQCLVFEVGQSKEEEALERNTSIFSVLPSRIFMYEEDNCTVLATLKPTALLAEMFHMHQLPEADQEVENTLIAIMKQATGG
ncbi:DUF302 domain-containing protein [Desulfopila sp. IMCC35008]|uniref:DUF302 domain-containing protein n=1 Tax=Desulfopila sp. IMCC35008 TaxID=2653858 RepID=UPI0013D02E06|nr:DUF302 domain-containing protein [Desulfopila sp. IMCC35008]